MKVLIALCLGLSTAICVQSTWLVVPALGAQAKARSPEFENQYLKIQILPGWTVAASGDSVARRAWRLDPAIELRGAALVRRACDVVLPGAMSRRTPVELKSAPMLDRVHELDACA